MIRIHYTEIGSRHYNQLSYQSHAESWIELSPHFYGNKNILPYPIIHDFINTFAVINFFLFFHHFHYIVTVSFVLRRLFVAVINRRHKVYSDDMKRTIIINLILLFCVRVDDLFGPPSSSDDVSSVSYVCLFTFFPPPETIITLLINDALGNIWNLKSTFFLSLKSGPHLRQLRSPAWFHCSSTCRQRLKLTVTIAFCVCEISGVSSADTNRGVITLYIIGTYEY